MIVDVMPEAVVFLPEERDLICSLAEEAGGHLRVKWGSKEFDARLWPIEDLLEDLASTLGREPRTLTLNATASEWHRDARQYEDCVIAWIVHGRVEGGALAWKSAEGFVDRYEPKNGDVARMNAADFEHRIEEIVKIGTNAVRASIVLA